MAEITQEILKELFYYHPESGDFVRLKTTSPNARSGMQAGCADVLGYLVVRIDDTLYRGSRLAWLYMTGEWPAHEIDHKNRNAADNSWKNLREATRTQNNRNKKCRRDSGTGLKGVTWQKSRQRYRARIGGRHLGLFDSVEEARSAYLKAAAEVHGEYANGG